MPALFAVLFAARLAAPTDPPAGAAPPAADCRYAVTGRVVDAATAEAIPRVDVTLKRQGAGDRHTTTDDDGRFAVPSVCPGRWRVTASRADYEPHTDEVGVAQEPPAALAFALEPLAVDVLEDVVVVAPPRTRVETAASDTLDAEALAAVRGRSLADSIAGISGVAVLRSPAGGLGKPIIRGQVGRRNLILYDRVPLESQKWGIDHAPEIDPFAADSITVIKGAGGIRYGPAAIGGVVLIDPPPLPTEPGVSGEAHLIGVTNGMRGTTATRVQGAHRRLPGLGWRLEYNGSRGAAQVTPEYPLDNTGSRLWNAGATVGWARRGWSVTGTFRHYAMQAGIFTGLRTATPQEFAAGLKLSRPVAADLYTRDYRIDRPYQQVRHEIGIVRGRAPLGRVGDLVATYAMQQNRRDEFDIVRQAVAGPQLQFDLRANAVDLVLEQAPVTLSDRAELEGSAGTRYAHRTNRYHGADPAFLPDYDEDAGGVFVIERVVTRAVEIEGGARYDGLNRRSYLDPRAYGPFAAQGRLPDTCVQTDAGGRCPTIFHAGSGSAGLLLRPVPRLRQLVAKLDASTAVRFPSTDEQFIKGSAPSFPVFANGDGTLGRERTWTGALTLSFANPWIFAEGSAYGSYIDNYIYFRFQPQSMDPTASNYSECAPLTCGIAGAFPLLSPIAVDSAFYGGEVSTRVQPPKWPVSLDGQAWWVRARQVKSGAPLQFIPPDHYRLGLTYHWPDVAGFSAGFVGVGTTVVDRQRHFDPTADFANPPPAYALLSAQAGIERALSGQRLAVALVGTNLTNARYRDYTSLMRYFANEPGWSLSLRATLFFDFTDGR